MRLLLALALLAPAVAAPLVAQPADSLRILIPLYVFPDRPNEQGPNQPNGRDEWRRLVAISDRAPVTAIVNPSNGPRPAGTGDHTAYTEGLPILDSQQIRVIGYVRTCYLGMGLPDTRRPEWCRGLSDTAIAQSIANDIATWVSDYPDFVEGIFLDEAAYEQTATTVPLYTQLCRDVRDAFGDAGLLAPVVLLNPGTRAPAGYTASGDCNGAVLFEGRAANFPPSTLAGDVSSHGQAQSGGLIYAESALQNVAPAVETAAGLGLSYIYVTNDPASDNDPWDTVPPNRFLNALADAVEAANTQPTAIEPVPGGVLSVGAPTPNPTAGRVAIPIRLFEPMPVRAQVVDVLGRELAVLHDGPMAAGAHTLDWTPPPGAAVYLLRVTTHSEIRTVRLTRAL